MAFAFDTLAYAKHLRDAGVGTKEAEAHAEAARTFIMTELVTKSDLETVRRELDGSIAAVRGDLATLRRDIEGKLDTLSLRLTVRLGAMLGVAIAALATLIKL